MKQYLDIIKNVLESGVVRENRTDQKDWFIPSATITHDLRDGFPALTTKQLFYKQSIGEILGFIRGYNNADDFAKLGCRFWFSDANENKTWLNGHYRKGENDLGKIYGSTWRSREVFKRVPYWDGAGEDSHGNQIPEADLEAYLQRNGYECVNGEGATAKSGLVYSKFVDSFRDCIDSIINKPNDRRIIMHTWFPEIFDEMALPPCHTMYKFTPDAKNNVLHMSMFQRSCDLFLGVPMNLFGSALLLKLIADATGYTAGVFTHQMADVHLYEKSIVAATEQTYNTPLELASIETTKITNSNITTNSALHWLENIEPSEIKLNGYMFTSLDSKRVEMAQEKSIEN